MVDHEPSTKPAKKWMAERDALLELDSSKYPNIRASAPASSGHFSVKTYYQLGIDMVIEGIAAIADQRKTARVRSSVPSGVARSVRCIHW